MKLYEIKMYLKRLKIVKYILNKKEKKEENAKRISLRNEGINLIKGVEIALENSNLVYFADYGTLLGIIRDHQFISWDNDLDYGILIDDSFDWNYFEHNLNQYGFRKVREFKIDGHIKEQTYCMKKQKLTIDFFGHQNLGNKCIAYEFFRKENYIYHSPDEFHIRKAEGIQISGTTKVDFLGTQVSVPENAEEYLADVYTEKWKIPDPEWTEDNNPDSKYKEIEAIGNGFFY